MGDSASIVTSNTPHTEATASIPDWRSSSFPGPGEPTRRDDRWQSQSAHFEHIVSTEKRRRWGEPVLSSQTPKNRPIQWGGCPSGCTSTGRVRAWESRGRGVKREGSGVSEAPGAQRPENTRDVQLGVEAYSLRGSECTNVRHWQRTKTIIGGASEAGGSFELGESRNGSNAGSRTGDRSAAGSRVVRWGTRAGADPFGCRRRP